MSGIESILFNDALDFNEVRSLSWENNSVVLGLLFGTVTPNEESLGVLLNIFHSQSLDAFSRGFAAIKIFDCITSISEKIPDRAKSEESRLIREFVGISYNLESFVFTTGNLLQSIVESYTKCLHRLLVRFAINDDVIRIGIAAYRYKETFRIDLSFFKLELSDLEKIANSRNENPSDMLRIMYKSSKIVREMKYKPNDVLSIITYNTLYRIIKLAPLDSPDIEFSEKIIVETIINYTLKQKERLKEVYSQQCSKGIKAINRKVIVALESNYPSALENKERRVDLDSSANFDHIRFNHTSNARNNFKNKDARASGGQERDRGYQGERPKSFSKNENEEDGVEYHEVKRQITDLIQNIRDTLQEKSEINPEIVGERIMDLYNRHHKATYNTLCNASFHERWFTPLSIQLWYLILEAMEIKQFLPKEEMQTFKSYVEYIRENTV